MINIPENFPINPAERPDAYIAVAALLGENAVGAELRLTAAHDYYEGLGLTGPAFEHITPFAVQSAQLDTRCADWPVQTYTDLLVDSSRAQAGSRQAIELATTDQAGPIRAGQKDNSYARASRDAFVTPVAMGRYRSLYESVVATGEGLTNVITGKSFTAEQTRSLTPVRVPNAALRKRGFGSFGILRRGMNRREFDKFEHTTGISLVDSCIDAEGLAAEVGVQIDRIQITSALLDLSLVSQTAFGKSQGLNMFTSNMSERLQKLADYSQDEDGPIDAAYRKLYGEVMARYQQLLVKVDSRGANKDLVEMAKPLHARLERMTQWDEVRTTGEVRLRDARERRIALGLGATVVAATEEATLVEPVADEITNTDAVKQPAAAMPEVLHPAPEEQPAVPHETVIEIEDNTIVPQPIEPEPIVTADPEPRTHKESDFWHEEVTPSDIEREIVQLGWEVLPKELTMGDVRRLINDDPLLGRPGVVIDWRRIEDLLFLKDVRDGTLYRSKPGDLGCDLVYFVSVFEAGDTTVAVADNPVYGNATYVVAEHRLPGKWYEVLKLPRRAIREMGGIQKYHVDQGNHLAKVIKALNAELERPSLGVTG